MQLYLKDNAWVIKSQNVSPGFTKASVYNVNWKITPKRIKGTEDSLACAPATNVNNCNL